MAYLGIASIEIASIEIADNGIAYIALNQDETEKTREHTLTFMKTMRLNHFLSSCGICSRRKADTLIKNKTVTVNNRPVTDPAKPIHPTKDKIRWKGKLVHPPKKKWYIAFNKPVKALTTMSDPKNRLCTADFFKKLPERIFPVGRLDWRSEGLLLLTNNGDFAMQVLSQKPPKTYIVKLNGSPTPRALSRLTKGVPTAVGRVKALYARPVRGKSKQWIKVIIIEGKNRQLHRMFEKVGFRIKVLRRTAIGRLKLRSLKPGEHRVLSPADIKKVFSPPAEI